MDEYLQLPDDYDQRGAQPNKKRVRSVLFCAFIYQNDSFEINVSKLTVRNFLHSHQVRWADVEERKNQQKMRNLGFIVGQNWEQVLDPSNPEKALNRTKYI